jgi:8-oxo-dGTP pyrophosphatase MutT (NUDIX family)
MDLVATLPLRDGAGNVLVDFRDADIELAAGIPLPASLVVVTFADRLLMVLDRWRDQWELPGGMLEPGETARQAARRELTEETGISATELDFAGVAEFALQQPARREYAAIYRSVLSAEPHLVVNDEVADFLWWDPRAPLVEAMSPLDAEIGRRSLGRGG